MNALKRLKRPRFELFGDSLSGRVLWFTVSVILLMELVVITPGLGIERHSWLAERITHAYLVTYAVQSDTGAQIPPPQTLLALTDTEQITLLRPGFPPLIIGQPGPPLVSDGETSIDGETLAYSTWRAVVRLVGGGGVTPTIIAAAPDDSGAVLKLVVNGAALTAHLRAYALHTLIVTIIVALITGLLVYSVLDRLLVRPMRIITSSIRNFREAPEQANQSDLAWLATRPEDDISSAARELKTMQDELRTALWRNARLAAVGTSVAKLAHDLRNILSTAVMVADRLQSIPDPAVQRATRTLIPAVDRAAQLVTRTVEFAREGPPPITRTAVTLAELIDEAILVVQPYEAAVHIENLVPTSLVLPLDRAQIFRVLVNLLRNAVDAGAHNIAISTIIQGGLTRMRVADDGPGLPLRVLDNLFKPFTGTSRHGGTGLGLAIARDIIRAHGGELTLEQTSPRGTIFGMDLAISDTQL
ncbi:HAMP domain-containing sensor histidine kinase [Acidocella sp.]|uniref:sensor histidine kinase n=1 Tax=Acidocella sp. TaxID=50710 RepID=UPI002609B1D9|nr:HAMP domain-containing sensor histidine kinase [Acidocella sp.]